MARSASQVSPVSPARMPHAWPSIIAYVAAGLGLVLVFVLLSAGHALLSLLLACLLTMTLTSVIVPRTHRLLALWLLFTLPFVGAIAAFRPDDFNYSLYYSLIALALVLVGLIQPRPLPWSLGTIYVGYLLFAGTIALLLLPTENWTSPLASLLMMFAVYVLARRLDRRDRRIVIGVLLGFCAIQAVIGSLQSWFGWPVFPQLLEHLYVSDRNYFAYVLRGFSTLVTQGSGTFLHFNGLGAVLSLGAPIAFGLWLEKLRSPWRGALFAVILTGVVTTYSRGALLGALAGCAFVLLFDKSRSRRVTALLVACVVAIAVLLALNTMSQYYETTGNVSVRTATWKYALKEAATSPSNFVAGHGYTYFHEALLSGGDLSAARKSGTMSSLHSGPLQLLLEFGVIGAILFVAWLVAVFAAGLGPRRSYLTVTLLGGSVAFLVHQMLDTSMFDFPGVLLVLCLALVESEAEDESAAESASDPVAQSSHAAGREETPASIRSHP